MSVRRPYFVVRFRFLATPFSASSKEKGEKEYMCIRDASSHRQSQEGNEGGDVSKKPLCKLWLFVGVLGTDAVSSTVLLTFLFAL